MRDGLLLTEKTKEGLIEEIFQLQKKNEALKKKLGEKEQTKLRKKFLKLQRLRRYHSRASRVTLFRGH